ncbi:MAG TPA: hypothetical protein V6D11_13020 [Waterburya sp.]|jgi:hypothetical protein
MTELPPDDQQWQEFLRKHRPTPPPEPPDREEQLFKAMEESPQPVSVQRLWAWPPALIAGLLMVLSSYRVLIPSPEPTHSTTLEAFVQDNWNEVVGETSPSIQSNPIVQVDWQLEANAAQ